MIRTFFLLAIISLLVNTASAQMGGGGMGPEPLKIPEVDSETLIYQTPAKWYPFSKESEAKNDIYLFPTGQKPEKWKELLQFEIFSSTMGVTAASQVFDLKTKNLGTSCTAHTVVIDKDNSENDYSMHQWTENCTTADAEILTIRKAIVGVDKLYLTSKIWKYEPRESDLEKWTEYMNQVYVCDGTEAHNCRPPNPPARQGGMGR